MTSAAVKLPTMVAGTMRPAGGTADGTPNPKPESGQPTRADLEERPTNGLLTSNHGQGMLQAHDCCGDEPQPRIDLCSTAQQGTAR